MTVLERDEFAVRVLGPFEVTVGERSVVVGSGRLRALLGALALSAGTMVSVDRLIELVWGEDLPDNPRRAVHTYVNRLRRVLDAPIISTGSDGYALRVLPERVDALRFRTLVRAAAAAGDPAAERAVLGEALALWRGLPFDGVQSLWLDRVEKPHLTEVYLAGAERAADLDLAAGRGLDLVPWLADLSAQHPLRESLWLRLLAALAASGRHAEALQRYDEIRLRLADELGVDPNPGLQSVYTDLLAGRPPVLDGTAALTVPRQLPADVRGFTGRKEELARLDQLAEGEVRDGRGALTIVAISGTAGVGKTTLAVHWAHRAADLFPDGQLYADLRGFDPVTRECPATVIRAFLDGLGVPRSRIPENAQAQAAMYRTQLAGRRMLVLLDNARDVQQVRPLLPGTGGCVVVVTSRDKLTGLVAAEGAHPIGLDLLGADDARMLLSRRLGADRVAAEPKQIEEIVHRCARLPLALVVVAARAATHPWLPLAALAGELPAADGELRNALDLYRDIGDRYQPCRVGR